jgi:hypothetical protein
VEGVPSGELYTVVLSREPRLLLLLWSVAKVWVEAGEGPSFWLSPCWLSHCQCFWCECCDGQLCADLSVSFGRACVFFRLGAGMRHSMEKAVQLVQGTPRLAASHRTYPTVIRRSKAVIARGSRIADRVSHVGYSLYVRGRLEEANG